MASGSEKGLVSEKKRELLQSYGLNPDEFLSDPSPKASLYWRELYACLYIHCIINALGIETQLRES